MAKTERRGRRGPTVVRVVRARPRLFISFGVACVVTAALGLVTTWRPATRLLVGWDVGVGLFLGLIFHVFWRSDLQRIRRDAASQDEGRLVILTLIVAAALASLAAILLELASSGDGHGRQAMQLVVAAATIVLSWAMIHTIFALHYAHEFYDERTSRGRGLAFPGGEKEPDYWDFVYFSFVIGMTSQVSDVGVTSKRIRRTVSAHGVVSFFFNAALLALTVNIAASAI